MSDVDSDNEEISNLSNPDVTTKYRTAGDIVNKALQAVVAACVDEADIYTLCELGDNIIDTDAGKLYNKKQKKDGDADKPGKKMLKGLASPTCISVNEIIGSFSPLKGESRALKNGDVVKIDMACHIDGFIAAAGHTLVVGVSDGEKVEDRRADVIMAAWNAAEAALRLVQPGNTNTMVTKAFTKIASEFNCVPVQGIQSHEMKKHVIDGNRVILGHDSLEDKVEEFEFDVNEVYCLDVVMSSGEGKGKESELRTTVYKRQVQNAYLLKTQRARQFISEVNRRFPALPFSLRNFEDENVARVGVAEAKRHELLEEYPVLHEKPGQFVAQFKFTALILPGGTKKITGLPIGDTDRVVSRCQVQDEEMKKLLATSANPKKQKKKKKEAPKDEDEA